MGCKKLVETRNIKFWLHNFNRSLDLCARMNYETEILDFIDSLEREDVLYDLGACEGRFLIYAQLKGLNVYSFEPDESNFKVLKSNLILNDIDSDRHFNLGVGEEDRVQTMQIGQPWAGGHQKIVVNQYNRNDLNFNFSESKIVEIVSLDSFIIKNHLPFPNAIKIDIDGSEVSFLKGAIQVLQRPELKKIIFELNKKDSHYPWIINFLNDIGFKQGQEFQIPNEQFLFNINFTK
jgi:FkbM family methyltransferase